MAKPVEPVGPVGPDEANEVVLEARGVSKALGNGPGDSRPVLRDVSLAIPEGRMVALLGPSGCGKTTLLSILAGFLPPDEGQVLLHGREAAGPGPDRGVVFQEDGLFPWLDGLENVLVGLKARGIPRTERRDRALAALGLVGLAGHEHKRPGQLSGGMRQRLALARVIALRPRVLLLDEPFASLDAISREHMQEVLARLQAELGLSALLVTHDVTEAARLADHILVMGPARDLADGKVHGAVILERFELSGESPRDPDDPGLAPLKRRIRQLLRQE